MIGVGIIGCGLIGQKRAKALGLGGRLVATADIDLNRAKALAGPSAVAFSDWRELLLLPDVEMVIVATLHDSLAEITLAAVTAGKHVLVEKPAGRTAAELEPVMVAAKATGVKVHVGFNHRYHRAIRKAKEIVDSGVLGELMFLRARYGHGGRIGYDREWRSKPELSGGGAAQDRVDVDAFACDKGPDRGVGASGSERVGLIANEPRAHGVLRGLPRERFEQAPAAVAFLAIGRGVAAIRAQCRGCRWSGWGRIRGLLGLIHGFSGAFVPPSGPNVAARLVDVPRVGTQDSA